MKRKYKKFVTFKNTIEEKICPKCGFYYDVHTIKDGYYDVWSFVDNLEYLEYKYGQKTPQLREDNV